MRRTSRAVPAVVAACVCLALALSALAFAERGRQPRQQAGLSEISNAFMVASRDLEKEDIVAVGDDPGGCPYFATTMTEAECRSLPLHVRGRLHKPFVITDPVDPRGCFQFLDEFYFNNHEIGGVSREGRKLFCRRSPTPLRFQKITGGKCVDYGYLPIEEHGVCENAARDLGLANARSAVTLAPNRPEGCYYFQNFTDGTSTLWMSTNAHTRGRGVQGACEYVLGVPGQRDCPAGTLQEEMTRNDCMSGAPSALGGGVAGPVITSPDDPPRCFRFKGQYFYNLHPVGHDRLGREPVCRRCPPTCPSCPAHGADSTIEGSGVFIREPLCIAQTTTQTAPSQGAAATTSAPERSAGFGTVAPLAREDVHPVHHASCPVGMTSLTESECRGLPHLGAFHGDLHHPFVGLTAEDPPGCFSFLRWLYYNRNASGLGRPGRTLYCKRSSATETGASGLGNAVEFVQV